MRVALYYAPPAGQPLSVRAAAWLGRDAWKDEAGDHARDDPEASAGPDALVSEPRRYGFHATLKPPFRLAAGRDSDALRMELARFCGSCPPVLIPALSLVRLGSFFALVPEDDVPGLSTLAGDVVRRFEAFRAPLTEAEIARRRPERLSERQRDYLAAWGYPYVFEEFRFHMTLTGPVPEDERDRVEALLQAEFAAFIGRPLAVDRICIFLERDPPDNFVVDTAIPLTGPAG